MPSSEPCSTPSTGDSRSPEPVAGATDALRQPRAFRRLWTGQAVSELGNQITLLALPLVAIKTLHAGPLAVGFLAACETIPFLVVGLPFGVLVDRRRRRPLLITTDLIRAAVLGTVPVAAAWDALTMAQLVAVALATGVCSVLFDLAHQSYVPSIVPSDRLLDANARLESTRSAAQVVGPGIAGVLVQVIKAPFAVLADAVSYLVSAAVVAGVEDDERRRFGPGRPAHAGGVASSIAEGVRFVARNRLLRPLALYAGAYNLFSSVGMAVFILFAVRTLGLSAGMIGVIFSVGSLGFLGGSLTATRIARRFGVGATMVVSAFVEGAGFVLVPLAPRSNPIPLIVAGIAIETFANSVCVVLGAGIRQLVTPSELLGRMTATFRFVVRGMLPVGSIIGGALGAWLGLRPTLWVSAIGTTAVVTILLPGPLRTTRTVAPPDDGSADGDAEILVVGGEPALEGGGRDGATEHVTLGDVAAQHAEPLPDLPVFHTFGDHP